MPKETSSRTAILQNLWKKAHIQGQVAIPVPSKSDAQKLRFDLYNVVKACKKDPKLDAELAEAANNCSISFVTETTVLIKKKVAEMFLIEAALLNGIDPTAVQESPRNEAELAALESQKRLAEAMNKGAMPTPATQPQHRPNAYFDRTKD